MLSFAPNIRIFLHARPTDMRKSFDGLCGLVRGVLAADPLDGSPGQTHTKSPKYQGLARGSQDSSRPFCVAWQRFRCRLAV